jgi:hypothetical protein
MCGEYFKYQAESSDINDLYRCQDFAESALLRPSHTLKRLHDDDEHQASALKLSRNFGVHDVRDFSAQWFYHCMSLYLVLWIPRIALESSGSQALANHE